MKKIIPVALSIAAVPALLLAQTVTVDCPEDRCQVAPYFAGTGGFVGTSAGVGGQTDVQFFLICGTVTISATAVPDRDGVVRQALSEDNGLYCRPETRGRIEVDNLEPGGWYWINDDRNSAVAAFIPKEAMANEQFEPTDPGGIVLDSERGGLGTYVKHEPTGRVGIIPHVVPAKAIRGCEGALREASATNCHLGSSEDWRITASTSSVTRPSGDGANRSVVFTLHGKNFVTTRTLSVRAAVEYDSSVQGIVFGQTGGEAPAEGEAGVLKWYVGVGADDSRCLPANNHPDRGKAQEITFKVEAMDGAIPTLGDDGLETTFDVNCPDASAANAGAELVPENPFPPTVD